MPEWGILAGTRTTRVTGSSAAGILDVSFAVYCVDWWWLANRTWNGPDAEALQVLYDPDKVSYETLIEFFFRMHDPTTPDRQGPDVGSQYRSGIFYHSPEQESSAKKIIDAAQKQWFKGQNIATEVIPAGQWWDAEDYHQLYLNNNPGGYECPSQ